MIKITEVIRGSNIHFTIDRWTHEEHYIWEDILPRLAELDNMVSHEEVKRVNELINLMKPYDR